MGIFYTKKNRKEKSGPESSEEERASRIDAERECYAKERELDNYYLEEERIRLQQDDNYYLEEERIRLQQERERIERHRIEPDRHYRSPSPPSEIVEKEEKPELSMARLLLAVGFLVLVLVLGMVSSLYDVKPWDSVLPSVFQLLVGAVIGAVIGEKIGISDA